MAKHEFSHDAQLKAYFMATAHELKLGAKGLAKKVLGRSRKSIVRARYSTLQAKRVVLQEKLALADSGLSWFYTAFERNDQDPLTNFLLKYIEENAPKDSSILCTGCGTGIMVFHLADCGFKQVDGVDLLPECITVANRLKDKFGYDQTSFAIADGFDPKLEKQYDVITAVHWVFSAWSGNYGNSLSVNPRDPEVRKKLLGELISAYKDNLSSGGLFIVELTDAVADYRDPMDHGMGERSVNIYPVRHTPEQVSEVAQSLGFEVIEKRLAISYGHQPRVSYVLRKN